jgi:hypothetical protein
MRLDTIEVTSNVEIEGRRGGKLAPDCCRDFKNIWTYSGREWVTVLMSYGTGAGDPPAAAENNRTAFMGFGVGGDAQSVLPIGAPIDTDYPGYNNQTDSDPDIDYLERPVRIDTGAPTGDYWLRRLTWPDTEWAHVPGPAVGASRWVRYYCTFQAGEIDGPWSYPMVPLSEIGLFHYGSNGTNGEYNTLATVYTGVDPWVGTRPTPIAYHTFYSIPKTSDVELTVRWEVRVGG